MLDQIVVLTTASSEDEASKIAEHVVEQRLVACVNLVGPIRSVYRWQGEIQRDEERLLVMKTTRARFDELRDAIAAIHSYDVPEIIALPIVAGAENYLSWITEMTSTGSSP